MTLYVSDSNFLDGHRSWRSLAHYVFNQLKKLLFFSCKINYLQKFESLFYVRPDFRIFHVEVIKIIIIRFVFVFT